MLLMLSEARLGQQASVHRGWVRDGGEDLVEAKRKHQSKGTLLEAKGIRQLLQNKGLHQPSTVQTH